MVRRNIERLEKEARLHAHRRKHRPFVLVRANDDTLDPLVPLPTAQLGHRVLAPGRVRALLERERQSAELVRRVVRREELDGWDRSKRSQSRGGCGVRTRNRSKEGGVIRVRGVVRADELRGGVRQ